MAPRRTLAERDAIRVDTCGCCGALYLSIGPVTLRLTEESGTAVVLTLAEALERLQALERGAAH